MSHVKEHREDRFYASIEQTTRRLMQAVETSDMSERDKGMVTSVLKMHLTRIELDRMRAKFDQLTQTETA